MVCSQQENIKQSRPGVTTTVASLPPSGIRKFFDLVLGCPEVVSLGVGEPDFLTPWQIRDEAIFSLERGRTSYTSNQGLLALRQAASEWIGRELGVTYDPVSELLVTVGASEGLDLSCRVCLQPGDEVLVLQPCFVSYPALVTLAGGVPVLVGTDAQNGFFPTEQALNQALTSRTKAIMVNSPNNPTGAVLDQEAAERIARFAIENNLLVMSDEIYSHLTYGKKHISLAGLPGMRDRTILLHGMSKIWAMTGWRIGFVAAPADLVDGMTKIHQYMIMSAPTNGQFAAIEALKHSQNETEHMRKEYNRRRNFICQGFASLGFEIHEPQGAFYAFPSIKHTGLDSETFCTRLLHEQSVAVVPGNAFGLGGEGHIRCSYATSMENLALALDRIKEFVSHL